MVIFVYHSVFFKEFISLNSFKNKEKLQETARMSGVDSFKINDVQHEKLINNYVFFFILAQQPPRGPRPPHY